MLKKLLPITVLIFLLSACGGASTNDVSNKIQDVINEELRTSVKYNGIRAEDVKLKKSGDDFEGVVIFKQRKTGESESNEVTASLSDDGSSISYQYTPPTKFAQIKQSKLEADEYERLLDKHQNQ